MSEWRNAKVTGSVRKAFELATDIAWRFDDEKIRSAYLLFAAMNMPETGIVKAIMDMQTFILPDINSILSSKELFTQIFGKEAADKNFVELQVKEETPEQKEHDEFAEKVIGVLNELIGDDTEDYELLDTEYSDKLEEACNQAYIMCRAMNLDYLDLDVIIYCILQNKESSAYKFTKIIVSSLGIEIDEFIQSLMHMANIVDDEQLSMPVIIPKALETCIEVLNNKFVKGQETTILGRDKEIFKAFTIFSKKTKRNVVLKGKPGVGKSAIMEAITQIIVNETCPKEFIGFTVLSLDINAMVAGTKYRGEFETKVALLKTFLEGTSKVILFVDEMHQMLGAGGSTEGTVDLSGSLKPILARDDVVFVGATTTKEYNTILSRDGAFKRRFEVITIKEPKNHEVKPMIKGKIKRMEKHHGVKMPSSLVDYIILCSNCFKGESANPDRTLDLCDRSMAIAKMANKQIVSKADVNKVYEECFEKYDNIGKKEITATAYHEIGHYIVSRLTKKHKSHKVTAISIIPTDDFLGVNMLEYTDNIVSCDMEYVEAYLMSLLAGRVAQYKITKAIDSGASSDLQRAKEFARAVIMSYGMDDGEYKNICIVEGDFIGEKTAEQLNVKVNSLIQNAYAKTEVFVEEHWEEIDQMAKYLLKKKIVTSDKLDKFLKLEE